MEPFSENDPLYELLGKARPVEVRPNFTQNVMRAIRQEPQRDSVWMRVQDWFASISGAQYLYVAALAVVVLVAASALLMPSSQGDQVSTPTVAQTSVQMAPVVAVTEAVSTEEEPSLEKAVASDLDSMNELSMLLAQQDTSSLTDSQIAVLLY